MSGHSKWANIQHRKARVDAQRGKIFTKLVRELTVASRMGGPDPDANARLRAAINAAKGESMPADKIKRAIDKGSGKLEGAEYEELSYEGYGPSGVAFIVQAVTDNRNRTTPEIRHAFSKAGGNLGETGSVGWQFDRKGYITVPKTAISEDDLTELLIDAGAEDFEETDEHWGILTSPEDVHAVADFLEKKDISVISAQWTMIPTTEIKVSGKVLEKVMRMMEVLEDNDDVQNVWTNADFDEAEIQ